MRLRSAPGQGTSIEATLPTSPPPGVDAESLAQAPEHKEAA
jgi:hypothetical protein